jgi:hypothetical protein
MNADIARFRAVFPHRLQCSGKFMRRRACTADVISNLPPHAEQTAFLPFL